MWSFRHPTHLHFGNDVSALTGIAATYPPGCFVVVTGSSAARDHGYLGLVTAALEGREIVTFDCVEPEPTHSTVEALARVLASTKSVAVIALGGGSVIDAAKAAACLCGVAGGITPFMNREMAFERRDTGLVAIPTTAGTGSEVTPFSVLTNEDTGQKKSLPSPHFFPDHAIVVPEFVTTVPKKVRGDVGVDSLAHALEALWSVNANPVSDALAYQAIVPIALSFEDYYDAPTVDTAKAMMLGATMAGLAFSNTLTAGCHALSYPLCDELHISHGAACAITLEHVAALNAPAVGGKFDVIAKLLGLSSGRDVPAEVARLKTHADTIPSLGDLGVGEDDLVRLAGGAFQPLLRNNPVVMTEDVIVDVLRRAI
jgi:alcohol dehydrogenase